MDTLEFFSGERIVRTFNVFTKHRGKTTLDCTVKERWEEKFADTTTCGRPKIIKVKKTIGISEIDREEFESSISSSIGQKAIAEIKSDLRRKIGQEWRYDVTDEDERDLPFQAPKCGRETVYVYQLKRIYELSFRDRRKVPWRKDDFTRVIEEWVNRGWEIPHVIEEIPECNCPPQPNRGRGGLVNLVFRAFGITAPYRQTEQGLMFPSLGITLPNQKIEDILFTSLTVDKEVIPPYLPFLTDDNREKYTCSVLPYSGTATLEGENIYRAMGNLLPFLIGACIGAIISFLISRELAREGREKISEGTYGIEVSKEKMHAHDAAASKTVRIEKRQQRGSSSAQATG